ncbi:MAG: cytochrome c5 family protein [Oceanospirillaceae bacterium]|nr:cytochrome c5 family protein [Oceanospirillaceae bacterium]
MTNEATPVNLTLKIASIASVLGLSLLLSFNTHATSQDKLIERIKPVGQVCVEGDDSCGGAVTAVAASGPARTGVEVYDTKCALCHAAGVSGAPKFGTSEWTDRNARGIEALLATAISGINAMPAKGLCGDCSDDELQAAIEHMIKSAP